MALVVLMQLLRLCIPPEQCDKFMGVPALCFTIEIIGIASFHHRVICGLTLALYRYALLEKRDVLAQINERTLTRTILLIHLVITPLCTASYVQEMMSKREQESMVFYNYCLSNSVKWTPMPNPPILRKIVNLILLGSLILKSVLYMKMWRTISSQAQRYLPEEHHGRCKELSGLLLGKLVYSVSELIPMVSVISIHFISRYIYKLNEEALMYFTIFTMPSILLFILPIIQLYTTPTIRNDIKEGFLATWSKYMPPSCLH